MRATRGSFLLAAVGAVGAFGALSACQSLLGINDRTLGSASDAGDDTGTTPVVDAGMDGTTPGGGNDGASPGDGAPQGDDGGGAPDPGASQANARADDAVEKMMLAFWNQPNGYLLGTAPPSGTPQDADLASYTQAWDAVLDMAQRHKGARFVGTALTLFNGQSGLGTKSTHYDEEAQLVLTLVRMADVTGNTSYLQQARTLYQDVQEHWDSSCCKFPPNNVPGGIWQDSSQSVKSTTVNAAAIIGGAQLFVHTKVSSYLTFAEEIYGYWSANMVDPATYQVYESVSAAGVTKTKHTINEGLMIGAALELSAAEAVNSTTDAGPDAPKLQLAENIAGFLLQNETANVANVGTILSDGDDTTCTGDCAWYKGVAARYLGELYAATSRSEYKNLLYRSAQVAYTVARDPSTTGQTAGLYNTDWSSGFPGVGLLGATASAATMLSAAATIDGFPAADPVDTFQADEAVLDYTATSNASPIAVGLSNQNGGYAPTSWGYITNWGCNPVCAPSGTNDGQGIEFFVNATASTANLYMLNFHYAAGNPQVDAGNPPFSRLLGVDGASLGPVSFSATGVDWTTWSNQAVLNVWLNPGSNTVSLVYDSTQGGVGIINLDQVQLVQNLLKAQPIQASWDTTYNTGRPAITETTVTTPQGSEPAEQWVESNVPVGGWIKFYPQNAPFNAQMQSGGNYVASVTMSGSSMHHLDFFDGTASGGDIITPATQLTAAPVTMTTAAFKYNSTKPPEFQIRIDGTSGTNVSVNVTMWDFAVYPAP
ncbi:MAG TPA: glycoside hydrolase family 76 protein [Polyangiaceae bacterium]|jgi:predicted alpha-1,6-mannanase (GH76 family)